MSENPIENFRGDFQCENGQCTSEEVVERTFSELMNYNRERYVKVEKKLKIDPRALKSLYDEKYTAEDVRD